MSQMAYTSPPPADRAGGVPLAELVGGLGIACDMANGYPPEKVLRTAIVAVHVARHAGLTDAAVRDAYWTTTLRFLGCTGFAHEEAHLYGAGDDTQVRNVMGMADVAQPLATVRAITVGVGRGAGAPARAKAVARLLLGDAAAQHARAQCDVSVMLAKTVGVSEAICSALAQSCERFDGKGGPRGARGEEIDLAARCLHLADVAEVANHRGGPELAAGEVQRRAGRHLDPELARVFVLHSKEILAAIGGASVWERFLAAEPGPAAMADAASAHGVAQAFASFADLKSVFTLGHSPRVAQLATAAAAALALPPSEQTDLRAAALLHDLGRVSVATGVWDKPGPLGDAEWERVRLHAYFTERIMRRAPAWAGAARLAAAAHERADRSGYPHGAGELPAAARVLAAADVLAALMEPRPHRPAYALDAAAAILTREVAAGKLERAAADAVLAMAGVARPVRPVWPRGLTDREVAVLRWLARGKTNKEIGTLLGISARTAQNHIAHIYDKIGVYSRAGAGLFAVENALL